MSLLCFIQAQGEVDVCGGKYGAIADFFLSAAVVALKKRGKKMKQECDSEEN